MAIGYFTNVTLSCGIATLVWWHLLMTVEIIKLPHKGGLWYEVQ